MSMILWFFGACILYLFSRGIVFYHSFFSISRHAYYIANIEPIRSGLIGRMIEYVLIFISSPIVGFSVMNVENANEMMLTAFKNTASKFSNPENARNFMKAAEELWEKELAKEKA